MSTKKKSTKKKSTKNLVCLNDYEQISVFLERIGDYRSFNIKLGLEEIVEYYLSEVIGMDIEHISNAETSGAFFISEMSVDYIDSDQIHEKE